jgi:two-component system alkaline phosphatase synthesis response regulator PhoP
MIYLVEDDACIRELVIYTLRQTGYEAKGFSNGTEFWQALREKWPCLLILDIMLPDEDGLSILKRVRAQPNGAKLPVMMMTAKGTEYDKVIGLDLGADDYLAKPVGMMELVARVRSLLRRTSGHSEKEIFTLGALTLSVPNHTVSVNGTPVTLTLKEFDLLAYLLRNQGIVLTRDQILSTVWGYDFSGESRTVDTHILTLRGKLGVCGELIQTVRGVGYKLNLTHSSPDVRI